MELRFLGLVNGERWQHDVRVKCLVVLVEALLAMQKRPTLTVRRLAFEQLNLRFGPGTPPLPGPTFVPDLRQMAQDNH